MIHIKKKILKKGESEDGQLGSGHQLEVSDAETPVWNFSEDEILNVRHNRFGKRRVCLFPEPHSPVPLDSSICGLPLSVGRPSGSAALAGLGRCVWVRFCLDSIICAAAGTVEAGGLSSCCCNPALVLVKAVIGGLWSIHFGNLLFNMLLKELASYKEKSVFSRLYSKWCSVCVYQM